MTNLIIYEYYYRGKSQRKIIKDLVSTNNITEAQTKINVAITEHDNYITNNNIANDGTTFTSVDNLSLHHAQDHLNALQQSGQQNQKDATIEALDEIL